MENTSMITMQDMEKMAQAACKSGLFKMPSIDAALTLMICQSEGIHPIQAMKRYHIIQGRPSMRSDAMLAEFQRLGGTVEWQERTDTVCRAVFSHPSGGSCPVEWTIEMAKTACLLGNDTWKKYPRQMLTARVISEGVRTVLPATVTGIYTPEEIQDVIDVTPEPKVTKPKVEKPVAVAPTPKAEPTPIEKAQKLVDKIAAERGKPAEFEPVDAEIVLENVPEIHAAQRPVKPVVEEVGKPGSKESVVAAEINKQQSAKQVADELKQLRKLAQNYGCKTATDFCELMQVVVSRPVETAASLNSTERTNVIAWLEDATKEASTNG